MRRFRLIVALALAVSAAGALTLPVAGATILEDCSGTCGDWHVQDMGPSGGKGAVCKYETNSYDLDFISVRPPFVEGPYSSNSKVSWRFKVLRSSSGGSWSTYYTSSWQNAQANKNDDAAAGDGFSRPYWYAPESPTGWFKIRVYIRWYNMAGSAVIGNAAAEYDHYKRLWSNSTGYSSGYCIQDW